MGSSRNLWVVSPVSFNEVSANGIITKRGLRPFPLRDYKTAVTSPSLSQIHLAFSITDQCTTCCTNYTFAHHCSLGYTKELLILYAEHIVHTSFVIHVLKVEKSVSTYVVLGFWLRMGDRSGLSAKGNNQ